MDGGKKDNDKYYLRNRRELHYFVGADVIKMRMEFNEYLESTDEGRFNGWKKSNKNLMGIFNYTRTLKIKSGFRLESYVCSTGMGGFSRVFAMPENVICPDPANDKKAKIEDILPAEAIVNFMEVIHGDNSPWSYIEASIFQREISNHGARWHSIIWGAESIITKTPFNELNEDPVLQQTVPSKLVGNNEGYESPKTKSQWDFLISPKDWRPIVLLIDGKAYVQFYS